MSNITVIIPVCDQVVYTQAILNDIAENTEFPKKIIVIDNASTDATPQVCKQYAELLPLEYVRNETNIGVNASWNMGLEMSDTPLVSILNNDLILPKFFFRKLEEVFRKHENCGIAVPRTTQNIAEPKTIVDNADNTVRELLHREGWAFTIWRDLAMKVGPVPSSLFTFYGDDWFFYGVKGFGFSWLRMMDNPVYHHLSRTLYSSGGAEYLGDDQDNWSRLMARGEKNPRHWTSIPHHQDMSPYAIFYQDCVKKILDNNDEKRRLHLLEFYSRWGVSARIMLAALPEDRNWKMFLVERQSSPELFEIVDDVRVEFWKGDIEKFVGQIHDNFLDLIHVDADPHEYEQTKNYFDALVPKLRVGGIMIFHDCSAQFGVQRFVREYLDSNEAWQVWYADPHPACPPAVPCAARRLK